MSSTLPTPDFLRACADDPLFFFEECCHIQDKLTKKLIPFNLNPEQRDSHDVFWQDYIAKKPVRIAIVKPRQVGFSTWADAILYWAASTQAHTRALIVGNEESTAVSIFETVQRFVTNDDRTQRKAMPMVRSLGVKGVTFGNPDARRRMRTTGLDSSIGIRTADNRAAGHSWSGRFVHGTECARWKYPEVLNGLLNAIADAPYTVVILESTGHGAAGAFYDIFTEAVDGTNEWTPIFISWKDRPEYTVVLTPEEHKQFEPTPEELELMRKHGLGIEQLAWRRKKIASPACKDGERTPEDVFREQYPLEWEEAFQSASKAFFDMHIVSEKETIAKGIQEEKQFKSGVLIMEGRVGRGRPARVAMELKERGYLTVWEDPIPGQDYVIGADTSAGLQAGDWDNAYAMHRNSQRFVARLRSKDFYPEKWGEEILPAFAWLYNQAFLAIEANSVGIVSARKAALVYPRVAYKIRLNQMGNVEPDPDYPGFWTDRGNRPDLVLHLRNAIRHGTVFIPCPVFWSEARTFVVPEDAAGNMKEGQPRAMRKKKDDAVMSAALTLRVNDPFLGAGAIRCAANAEPEEVDFRKEMLKASSERLFKRIWSKVKRGDFDDIVGGF